MRVFCENWDSYLPERLIDDTGKNIGVLQPRVTIAVLRASPGISDKSIPKTDERDPLPPAEFQYLAPSGVILR